MGNPVNQSKLDTNTCSGCKVQRDVSKQVTIGKLFLRLQYTFGSAIFFKFGFLGQNSGRRMISNFWKKNLKKVKYWRRTGGFTFSPEVKVYFLIDSPMALMQSTETIFTGITCMDVTNWLLSWSALLFWLPSIFDIRRVSIKL